MKGNKPKKFAKFVSMYREREGDWSTKFLTDIFALLIKVVAVNFKIQNCVI